MVEELVADGMDVVAAVEGTGLRSLVLIKKEMDGGVGTLTGGADYRTEDDVREDVEPLLHPDDIGADDTRVGSIDGDAAVLQPPGEVEGKEGDGQLGVVVDGDAPEAAPTTAPEEIREVQTAPRENEGGHIHDARSLAHQRQQQAGEEKGADIVDTHRALESVHGGVEACLDGAGIVHQAVQMAETALDGIRKGAHAGKVGKVQADDFDGGAARLLLQPLTDRLCKLRGEARHDDVETRLCHGAGLLEPHTGVGACDDTDFLIHFVLFLYVRFLSGYPRAAVRRSCTGGIAYPGCTYGRCSSSSGDTGCGSAHPDAVC